MLACQHSGSDASSGLIRRRPATAGTRILVMLGKGGGGKSTTAINLATTARATGASIGIVDTDPQRSVTEWRLTRKQADIPVATCAIKNIRTAIKQANHAGMKWLIVDTAPIVDAATIDLLAQADMIIVPFRPSRFDIAVTAKRIELLSARKKPFGVVITAAPPRREGRDAPFVVQTREALRVVGAQLWRGQITQRHAISAALTAGLGVCEAFPDSLAVKEYRNLWADISLQLNSHP